LRRNGRPGADLTVHRRGLWLYRPASGQVTALRLYFDAPPSGPNATVSLESRLYAGGSSTEHASLDVTASFLDGVVIDFPVSQPLVSAGRVLLLLVTKSGGGIVLPQFTVFVDLLPDTPQ